MKGATRWVFKLSDQIEGDKLEIAPVMKLGEGRSTSAARCSLWEVAVGA